MEILRFIQGFQISGPQSRQHSWHSNKGDNLDCGEHTRFQCFTRSPEAKSPNERKIKVHLPLLRTCRLHGPLQKCNVSVWGLRELVHSSDVLIFACSHSSANNKHAQHPHFQSHDKSSYQVSIYTHVSRCPSHLVKPLTNALWEWFSPTNNYFNSTQ